MATSSEVTALEAQRDALQQNVDALSEVITNLKATAATTGSDSGSDTTGGASGSDSGNTGNVVSAQIKHTEAGGDWVEGTWQGSDRGGLLIENTSENKAAFTVGQTIVLDDNTEAVLDYVQEQTEGITIWGGKTKFSASNGYPKTVKIKTSASSGATGSSQSDNNQGGSDTTAAVADPSLPYTDTLIAAQDKTLTVKKNSNLVGGKIVVQLATGQAVNVIDVKDGSTAGQQVLTIDQNISDPTKVVGKQITVRDRYSQKNSTSGSGNTSGSSGSTGGTTAPSGGGQRSISTKLTNIPLVGINLAAVANANQVLPGEEGTHYRWPSRDDVTLYIKTLGLRLIRFPYAYQRAFELDQTTGLPAYPPRLTSDFKTRYANLLNWIREDSNGEAKIIPDPHTYWRIYRNQTSNGKPTGALYSADEAGNQGNRWKRQEQILIEDANGFGAKTYAEGLALFAKELDDQMVIGWGLGNEPYPGGSYAYAGMQAKVIKDLNVILPILRQVTQKTAFICGCQWASARGVETYSGDYPQGIKDPANNWILEGHGYGDVDKSSSGKYNSVPSSVSERQLADIFTPFYAFGAANNQPLFVGETGIPPNDSFRQALVKMLDEAEAAGVPTTLWIAGGNGAMNGEIMNLDDSAHTATRDILKSRAGRKVAQWGVPKKI